MPAYQWTEPGIMDRDWIWSVQGVLIAGTMACLGFGDRGIPPFPDEYGLLLSAARTTVVDWFGDWTSRLDWVRVGCW